MNIPIISTIVDGISNLYSSYTDRKKSAETAQAKLKYKRETGDQTVTFTDQEWEEISKRNENESWKDEYITIVITAPLVMLFIGVIASVYTGNTLYQEAAEAGIEAVKQLLPNFEEILAVVVFAAVSIKGIKSVVRR